MLKRRLIALLTAAALLFQMIPATKASAATDITGRITQTNTTLNLTRTDGTPILPDSGGNYSDIPRDARLFLRYEFELPDEDSTGMEYDYAQGDTYQVQFPVEIKYTGIPAEGVEVKTEAGELLGKLYITANGLATITFTDYVETHSLMKGWFTLEGTFKESIITDPDPDPVEFVFNGQIIRIVIKPEEPTGGDIQVNITKTGELNAASGRIGWTVKVTPSAKASGLSVKDEYGPNQEYVADSFTVNGVTTTDGLTLDLSARTLTYTFPNAVTTEQTLYFETLPTAGSYSLETGNNKTLVFNNTATALLDGVNKGIANAQVTLDFIKKTGYVASGDNRLINWTVTFNNNSQSLLNPVITDTLPPGTKLVENSVKLNSVPVTKGTGPGTYTHTTATSGDSLTLVYRYDGLLTGPAVLTYQTRVTDESLYDSNDRKNLVNKVEMNWDGSLGTPSDTTGVGIGDGVIAKTAESSRNFDNTNNVIHWTVVVNRNKIKITNAIVQDAIPEGQAYKDGTFKINDHTVSSDPASPLLGTLTTSSDFIRYEFGAGRTIEQTYTITFDTVVTDFTKVYKNENVSFGNKVTLSGDQVKNGEGESATATQTFSSQVLAKTAGSYDYTTREMEWRIVVNRNRMVLENAVVSDTLPKGMTFLKDTFTITPLVAEAPGLVGLTGYTVHAEDELDTQDSFTYTFPDTINQEYVITFKTRVKEGFLLSQGSKQFTNNVSLTTDYGTIWAGASKTVENPIVEKKHTYDVSSGSDYIQWIVDINPARLTLKNLTITDALQAGLALDTSTVKLYPMELRPDGTLVRDGSAPLEADKYTVDYDTVTNVFKLTLLNETDDAYQLEFVTDITVDSLTVVNTIVMAGSALSQASSTSKVEVVVSNVAAGGSGANGKLSITKVDEEGRPLKGAKFVLLDSQLRVLSGGAFPETGVDGTTELTSLRLRTYYIREVEAPAGYLRDTTLHKVRLTGDIRELAVSFENRKALGTIELIKQDDSGNALSGAVFELYKGGAFQKSAQSDPDGRVIFTGIEPGAYGIVEAVAPGHYARFEGLITATVSVNQEENRVETVVTPSIIPNLPIPGAIQVYKTDDGAEPKPLAGAVFTLYNSAGDPVDTKTTGEDGVVLFSNLPWGTYEIREITAPEGYLLNTEPIPAVVVNSGLLRFEAVNEKGRGDVELLKLTQWGSPLGGAEFALYDSAGNQLATVMSDADGRVAFKDVEVGTYTIREIRAPGGFFINATVIAADVSINTLENKVEVTVTPNELKNDPVPSQIYGTLLVKKSDTSGKPLEGAAFELYDTLGNRVRTGVSGADGSLRFGHLVPGSYTLKEITAPKGYILTTEVFTAVVGGGQVDLNVVNEPEEPEPQTPEPQTYPGTIQVFKVDSESKPLAGALFTLYDSKGEIAGEALSNENGIALFASVEPGSYTLKESRAPDGYSALEEVLSIVVGSSENLKFTARNLLLTEVPEEEVPGGWIDVPEPQVPTGPGGTLPQAGYMMDSLVMALGGGALLVGGSLQLYVRKRKKKDR